MSRGRGYLLALALFCNFSFSQQPKPADLPEEDERLITKEYSFNPLQSTNELKTGNFYAKKGNWKAAARRFGEATKWNPGDAEAWLRLGDAREKLKDRQGAREAYAKYIELAPEGKSAAAVKKKLASK